MCRPNSTKAHREPRAAVPCALPCSPTTTAHLDVSSFVLVRIAAVNDHTLLNEACKLPSQDRHNLKRKKKKSTLIVLRAFLITEVKNASLSPEHVPFLSQCTLNLDASHRQCGTNNPRKQTAFSREHSSREPHTQHPAVSFRTRCIDKDFSS